MTELQSIYATLLAPFIGSFLGVLIRRLPAGAPVAASRSRCANCSHQLAVRDLVPLLSWLVNRAHCRFCSTRISTFYPAIELGAVIVALWAGMQLSGWLLWATCSLGWCLLALAITDYRSMLLPDILTLPLIPAGLAVAWFVGPAILADHVIGAAAGFGSFLVMRKGYRRLRGREGLGLGDVKLMATAGAWLSWQGLPSVVLIAALSGLGLVAIRRLSDQSTVPDERIPFGPCICLAIWSVWLYGPIQLG